MLHSWSRCPKLPFIGRFRRLLWLALSFVLAATLLSALGQELHKTIGEAESKALISVSRVLASANPAVAANIFQSIGYAPDNFPSGWVQFPMVRKIETVYLAAEQHTPRQGSSVLALMAQSLAQQYPSVADDPAIKPILAGANPIGKFQYANLVQAAKPDAVVQRAILAISRYTEGREASAATILQFHFNLPPEVTYDILRTSSSNEEALSRGFERVPVAQRTPSLERVVAHLDSTYKSTATQERDLDPYRPANKQHPGMLASVRDQHSGGSPPHPVGPENNPGGPPDPVHGLGNVPPPPPGSGPANAGGSPPSNGGGGGGGGGGSPGGFPNGRSSSATDAEIRSAKGEPSVEFQARPQETYIERVPEWYGSAPVEFAEMVAVEGGAGGVVFGNRFQTHISKDLTAVEYVPLSDREGQLLFRFSDKTEGAYGPVRSDDVHAAYSMIYGDGTQFPAFHEGAGLPLLGIEGNEAHYDIVDGSVQKDGRRWTVVAHPSLAHVKLGRSVLMADVLPIGNYGSRPSLEQLMHQAGESDLDQIYEAMPTDVTNWKFTDAQLVFTLDGDQIVARNSIQPDGVDCFITAQEFRNGKVNFDATLVDQFNKFAPHLTTISEDYKRLSDFVPIFDLFRWARSQKATTLQNAPVPFDGSEQTIPTWVVLNGSGIELLFDDSGQTPLEVLQSKIKNQLNEFHEMSPDSMRAGVIRIEQRWLERLTTLEAIEREEMRFRKADNEFYRLHQQLSTALAALPRSKRDEIEDTRNRLEQALNRAASLESAAQSEEQKKSYNDANEVLIGLEASALPSQKDEIAQMRHLAESHAWKMVALTLDRKNASLETTENSDLYNDLLPVLPTEIRGDVEAQRSSLTATLDTLSATRIKYEQASDDLDDLDERVENHFEHVGPATQRKFKTLAEDPDSQEFDKFLTATAPVLAASRRKALSNLSHLESQVSQQSEAAEQAESQLEKEIASVFPPFAQWAKLLTSVQDIHN